MSSWFSSATPTGPNIHPVQTTFSDPNALFGPLTVKDLEWNCAGGINTETQTWYATLKDGSIVMCQIIHSSIGLLWPTIQVTFRHCDPKTNKNTWKSVTVSNFKVQADKRSMKSDQITVTMDPASSSKYTIEAKYDDEVQISLQYERLAEGFKIGAGPKGGFTYFGQLSGKPAPTDGSPDYVGGADGYAIHRFWPRCAVSGIMRVGSEVTDLEGARGVFIHAIQGIRPNILAASWNFANFQTVEKEGEEAVSLIMMEFTTTPAYGSKVINVGSVVVGDKLVAVTAGGSGVVGGSSVTHQDPIKDVETGYDAPSSLKFCWEGAKLEGEGSDLKAVTEGNSKVHAVFTEDLLVDKEGYKTKGLVEKVDVLGQIPYLIKKFVNYAAGTKPFIYTWLNPVKASITLGTGGETKTLDVDGYVFTEATMIS